MYRYILVVDDDISLAYAIQSYLSSKKKKIFVVNNSVMAIKLLTLYKFDLVVSDIIMPKYSGYDLLLYLRFGKGFASIPFIFLTAKGMTVDRIKGYDLGCSLYLTKPFHPCELSSIVNNLIGSSVSQDESYFYKDSTYFNINLTNRESNVLSLLVKGYTNKEISHTLSLSIRSIEKYVGRILNKTGTRNRTELAQFFLSKLLKANDGTRTRE